MITFTSPLIDAIRILIYAFIAGIELIERRGLRIRNVLKDFRLLFPSAPGIQQTTEIVTTKKSSQFQVSRR